MTSPAATYVLLYISQRIVFVRTRIELEISLYFWIIKNLMFKQITVMEKKKATPMFIVTLHRVSQHARGILLPIQGPKKGKVL